MIEADRIREVYRSYRADPAVQVKRDPANPGNRWILSDWQRCLDGTLSRNGLLPLGDRLVLDVGCGNGDVLAGLLQHGAEPARLYGVDLQPEMIRVARGNFPRLRFSCASGQQLDFPDRHFDLVFAFTVFSSIRDDGMSWGVANEIRRVLKRDGSVVWFDFRFNNPSNPHTHGVSKAAIQRLFPDFQMDLQTLILLPPLARRLGKGTAVLYPLFRSIPFLRTHYLGLLRRPL